MRGRGNAQLCLSTDPQKACSRKNLTKDLDFFLHKSLAGIVVRLLNPMSPMMRSKPVIIFSVELVSFTSYASRILLVRAGRDESRISSKVLFTETLLLLFAL